MPIEAGEQLLHYRLIDKIGEGGMGVVWKAEDTKLHRQIALKVLPQKMAADPERRARFEREARAVAALNHPNIVTLHSVEQAVPSDDPGQPVHFITMELVEGRTLRELLPKQGFSLQQLLEIAIPLTDAVSRAHRAGITHRDLKPDNIMIDQEGRLRVLDFGLAKLHESSGPTEDTQAPTVTSDTVEGRVLGTVAYMSPEQAEGKEVDARSDVFSLGTILYEMATGRRPFRGDTRISTISAILRDEPASITDIRPALPRHLGRIVRRALAKDRERRYASAVDLRTELEELKREIDSGDVPRAPESSRGRRSTVLAGVALLAVAAVVVALVLRGAGEDEPPAPTSPNAIPITTGIGFELNPTWSPEGEFIAYTQVRDASSDIMVQPLAGGEPVLRAGGPADESTPRWSPDGRYLAYVSTEEPGSFVWLVPPHGGAPKKLIDTGLGILQLDQWVAMGDHPWSPDGRTLLVSRLKVPELHRAIFRVDRDTGAAEQLTFPAQGNEDHSASYSLDGKRIVFVREPGDLMIMPASGGEPERLLAAFGGAQPAFRPDGRHLLFLSGRDDRGLNLWELDLETEALRQLTFETLQQIFSFSVSRTNRIAFQTFRHDQFFFVVDVATGERRQVAAYTGENFAPRFSPDGASIAYHSSRSGDREIYLHHLDGSPDTSVTNVAGQDSFPDWSPDGRQLVFWSSREGGEPRLVIANRDGGGVRTLVDKQGAGPARWSPDGERISFMSTDEGVSLWTIAPDGSDARQIAPFAWDLDWYKDSRRAIYSRIHPTYQAELIAVHLETGEERSLYVGTFGEIDVAPDGSAVAFCLGRGHMSMGLALLRLEAPDDPDGLPRAVGEPEYLVRAEGTWHVHNGGWSPDSKSIVYVRDQDYGDLYELVEQRSR